MRFFVFTLKGNQLSLHQQVKNPLWVAVPFTNTTIDISRGRMVIRKP